MRHRSWLGVAATVAALAAAAGCLRPSPDRAFALTDVQESVVGRAASSEAQRRFGGRLDLPAVQAYVSTVGERTARPLGLSPWPYHFTVLAGPEPRLFSLPGGQIFITRGLLEQLQSEAELAGLLGWELALVRKRQDQVQAGLLPQTLERAAEAAESALAGQRLLRSEVESLDRVVTAWSEVRYAPAMQAEADRLGLDYLAAAGYEPAEMVRVVGLLARLDDPVRTGRAEAVRDAIGRKYAGRTGRIGRQEFEREVLQRLRTR
jgi:beta-barrel assembly-enhancing protease